MADRDKIINYVHSKGIVLPVEISKLINSNILLASAYLSELVSAGFVKISSVKVGGSPLYYAPGQEAKLDMYIIKLHEKEQRAVNLLKEARVLNDSELDSLSRVCLRNAKDFAKAIEVVIAGEKQLFWKFHTAQKEEIESVIKSRYMKSEKKEQEIPEEEALEKKQEDIIQPKEEQKKEIRKEPAKERKEEPLPEKKEQKKEEPVRDYKKEAEKIQEDAKRKSEPKDEQRQIFEKKPEKQLSGTFYGKIKEFFSEHNIKILNEDIIKKNSQFWFIAQVPASIGFITYYCEAKNKKTISSSDLSEALARGQSKRLPVLFLADGKPSKSIEQMMENEFKNIIIKQI